MLTHAPWTEEPELQHGFLDRSAAESGGWDAVVSGLGIDLPVALPRQVHGTQVAVAEHGKSPRADALVTDRSGLLIGIVTADCVPILLVDRKRRTAAALHAGWRGAAAGIVEAAVETLGRCFGSEARDLEGAIGPAIGGCCYEVGPEVEEAFRARTGSTTGPAWDTRGERRHVDLRTAVALLLREVGVPAVSVLGPCTACSPAHHSFRRDGAAVGRQLSFVGWAAASSAGGSSKRAGSSM